MIDRASSTFNQQRELVLTLAIDMAMCAGRKCELSSRPWKDPEHTEARARLGSARSALVRAAKKLDNMQRGIDKRALKNGVTKPGVWLLPMPPGEARKIPAIKLLRHLTGMFLKEAKLAVESRSPIMLSADPDRMAHFVLSLSVLQLDGKEEIMPMVVVR